MLDGSEHIKILVLALLDHMYEYSIFSAIHLTIEILGLFLFLLVHKGQRKAYEQVQNNSKDSPNPSSFSFIFFPFPFFSFLFYPVKPRENQYGAKENHGSLYQSS